MGAGGGASCGARRLAASPSPIPCRAATRPALGRQGNYPRFREFAGSLVKALFPNEAAMRGLPGVGSVTASAQPWRGCHHAKLKLGWRQEQFWGFQPLFSPTRRRRHEHPRQGGCHPSKPSGSQATASSSRRAASPLGPLRAFPADLPDHNLDSASLPWRESRAAVQVSPIRKHTAAGTRGRLGPREGQQLQPEAGELLVKAHALQRSDGPLAAPPQARLAWPGEQCDRADARKPGSRKPHQSSLYGVVHAGHFRSSRHPQTMTDARLMVTDISHVSARRDD